MFAQVGLKLKISDTSNMGLFLLTGDKLIIFLKIDMRQYLKKIVPIICFSKFKLVNLTSLNFDYTKIVKLTN